MHNSSPSKYEQYLLDLNEYRFYYYMPNSEVTMNELGFFLKNKTIETYSYVAPTPKGEKEFDKFLEFAFAFFDNKKSYFILKHAKGEEFEKNAKKLEELGFIKASLDVSVMKWHKNTQSLKDNPALQLKKLKRREIKLWVEVFFDAFNYPKSLKNYITSMVELQWKNNIEFYVGIVSDNVVSCFCAIDDGNYIGIYGVGTKYRYQRRGYASAMLSNYIKEKISKNPDQAFCLQVHKDSGAEKLYKKIGFKRVFIQKRYDWNPYL